MWPSRGDGQRHRAATCISFTRIRPFRFQNIAIVLCILIGIYLLHNRPSGGLAVHWNQGFKDLVGSNADASVPASLPPITISPDPSSPQSESAADDHPKQGSESNVGSPIVPCRGARGFEIHRTDDLFRPVVIDSSPPPYAGSYDDLGIQQTWMTADERYGPYGRGEDDENYPRRKVDWDQVDWAELQNACALQNQARFGGNVETISSSGILPFPRPEERDEIHARAEKTTGRTAIVLRAWSTYEWEAESLWSLRSLITETALATGGQYAVYILMHVQPEHIDEDSDDNPRIPDLASPTLYASLVARLVPPELQNMTLLWTSSLLEEWYPHTPAHDTEHQMFQALQLFARQHPGFDHYWEMELDVRFTGHAGELLEAVARHARSEPRKQARQRASFAFMPSVHGTYTNFTALVNESLQGRDPYHAGVRISEIPNPIGPPPPSSPELDDFSWGVGQEADLITLYPCNNVSVHTTWLYRSWIYGFSQGEETPGRVVCPPAVHRCSWNLLSAVHSAQRRGLAISSESTMPSFALWHRMKMSVAPLPLYSAISHRHSPEELDLFINGGLLSAEHDGMAWGEYVYGVDGEEFRQGTTIPEDGMEPSFRFKSGYPQELWQAWMRGLDEGYDRNWLPMVVRRGGEVYLPNTILHPVHNASRPWDEYIRRKVLDVEYAEHLAKLQELENGGNEG